MNTEHDDEELDYYKRKVAKADATLDLLIDCLGIGLTLFIAYQLFQLVRAWL